MIFFSDAQWHELMANIHAMRRDLQILKQQGVMEMADFSKLQADVAAQGTVIDSTKTLLSGLSQQIADLKNQVSDPAAQAAIDALAAQVEAQSADLAKAVTDNTPAA